MKSIKIALVVSLTFLVIGCGQHSSTEDETVLFEINEPNYKATFATYNNRSSGSADGPTLIQRRGDLQFVLQGLYPEKQVVVANANSDTTKYMLELRWQDSADAETAKQAVRSRIQQSLGFSTRSDTVEQTAYMLSISDMAKLQNNAGGEITDDVVHNSKLEGSNWDVFATLPRMAQELSEKINQPVNTSVQDSSRYQFKLEISEDVSAVIAQLENKYGLTLDANSQPLERIIVSAANN